MENRLEQWVDSLLKAAGPTLQRGSLVLAIVLMVAGGLLLTGLVRWKGKAMPGVGVVFVCIGLLAAVSAMLQMGG